MHSSATLHVVPTPVARLCPGVQRWQRHLDALHAPLPHHRELQGAGGAQVAADFQPLVDDTARDFAGAVLCLCGAKREDSHCPFGHDQRDLRDGGWRPPQPVGQDRQLP